MDILNLPKEMLQCIGELLDYESLLNLITSNHTIHQSLRHIVGKKTLYIVNRDLMYFGQIPTYLRTMVRHIYVGLEWNRMENPFTILVSCLKKREHAGEDIRSIHINGVNPRVSDFKALYRFAPNVRQIVFGVYKHKMSAYKTLALQTNIYLGECIDVFKDIEKIIVRPCGQPSLEFRDSLETLVSNNKNSLKELDFQLNLETYFPVEIPRECRLRSLLTTSSMSTFLPDMENVISLRSLECSITNQVPIWKHLPNLAHVKLHVCVENWEFRNISSFFPNLQTLDLESVFVQNTISEESKPVLHQLSMMNGRNFGVVLLENFIAPELTDIFISPLSQKLNQHLVKYSKKIQEFQATDNITTANRIAIIKEAIIQHKHLRHCRFIHNRIICACDLLEFAMEFETFLSLRAKELPVEFLFEMDIKFKRKLLIIFGAATKWEINDLGSKLIIKLTSHCRILITLREIVIANLIFNENINF